MWGPQPIKSKQNESLKENYQTQEKINKTENMHGKQSKNKKQSYIGSNPKMEKDNTHGKQSRK